MSHSIKAIYENGVLRPLSPLELAEREEVEIIILKEGDEVPARALAALAEASESLAFLAAPEEDVYSPQDGEPV